MSFFDAVRYRVRVLLRPRQFARDRNDEICHHIELEELDIGATSDDRLSARELREQARRRVGNITYMHEERRMISGLTVFDALRQDIRFLGRLMRRRLAFSVVTVLTIALGIGAATSIFSVADAVLFRPLAFADPNRLIAVWLTRPRWKTIPGQAKRWNHGELSFPMFRAWRASQTSFVNVAVWKSSTSIIGGETAPEEMVVGKATASLLSVLDVKPALGSWFSANDNTVGGSRVAVVSYEVWLARFGGDARAVGQVVDIDNVRRQIIGVMPRGVTLDRGPVPIAYWIPVGQDTGETEDAGWFTYRALARLKPTVSLSAASLETSRTLGTSPEDNRVEGAVLTTLHDDQTRTVRRPLLTLLGAAGLLLLIACINVATLLMGEAAAREPELRTRTALGAGRRRLLVQLLTESLVLSGLGALVGTTLAFGATKLIVRAAPPSIPGLADVHLDVRVLLVALSVAAGAGVVFGLAPAIALIRTSRSVGTSAANHTVRGRGRAQRTLIACEVALSMVLLVAGGLLVRSFEKLTSVGFRPSNLLVVTPRFAWSPFTDSVRARDFFDDVMHRLRILPGVASVAVTTIPPFSNGSSSGSFDVEGRAASGTAPKLAAQRRSTSPDFFTVLGVPIVAGRAYTDDDRADAPLVVVVNETLARREWPNESAVGKRIKYSGAWRTVIGVAGDIATERASAEPPELIYSPLAQIMMRGLPSLIIRTRNDGDVDAATIRRAMQDVDRSVTVSQVDAMANLIAAALADDRLRSVLIAMFAAIAALLAAIGTYGVAAAAASRRVREMAIRMAVGASQASVGRLVIGSAAKGVAIGAVVGVGLAWMGTRLLAPYLFGVGTMDPIVYTAVAILLAATTFGATYVPARRAMRVRLVDTLTGE